MHKENSPHLELMWQMLTNKLWLTDIVTDMLSSDQVDYANEKVPYVMG